jgi:hypothetical protein
MVKLLEYDQPNSNNVFGTVLRYWLYQPREMLKKGVGLERIRLSAFTRILFRNFYPNVSPTFSMFCLIIKLSSQTSDTYGMADNIQLSSPNHRSDETHEDHPNFQTSAAKRRRKDDRDRTRVSRACDRCKR